MKPKIPLLYNVGQLMMFMMSTNWYTFQTFKTISKLKYSYREIVFKNIIIKFSRFLTPYLFTILLVSIRFQFDHCFAITKTYSSTKKIYPTIYCSGFWFWGSRVFYHFILFYVNFLHKNRMAIKHNIHIESNQTDDVCVK